MFFPLFSLENQLFGIHQTSFSPVGEVEFSELKTPLVYTFFPPIIINGTHKWGLAPQFLRENSSKHPAWKIDRRNFRAYRSVVLWGGQFLGISEPWGEQKLPRKPPFLARFAPLNLGQNPAFLLSPRVGFLVISGPNAPRDLCKSDNSIRLYPGKENRCWKIGPAFGNTAGASPPRPPHPS